MGKFIFLLGESTPDNCNFNFKFRLESNGGEKIMESYIGVYIAVEYEIVVEFKSAYAQLFKNALPFFVQVPVKFLSFQIFINFIKKGRRQEYDS